MVTDTGKAARAGAIKPLNAPAAVQVRSDGEGRPVAVRLPALAAVGARTARARMAPGAKTAQKGLQRRPGAGARTAAHPQVAGAGPAGPQLAPWQAVASVDDRWKVIDEWWRGPGQQIARMYYSLVLENGQRATVFRDLARNDWFRQSS